MHKIHQWKKSTETQIYETKLSYEVNKVQQQVISGVLMIISQEQMKGWKG